MQLPPVNDDRMAFYDDTVLFVKNGARQRVQAVMKCKHPEERSWTA